jgi:hypothetical protein
MSITLLSAAEHVGDSASRKSGVYCEPTMHERTPATSASPMARLRAHAMFSDCDGRSWASKQRSKLFSCGPSVLVADMDARRDGHRCSSDRSRG